MRGVNDWLMLEGDVVGEVVGVVVELKSYEYGNSFSKN